MNRLGNQLTYTTWGESHGPAIGVVIDGFPAGIPLNPEIIQADMRRRAPGKAQTSPRKEHDTVDILSGVYQEKSTGAPIHLMITNNDARKTDYEKLKDVFRPGHAQYTYAQKYGHYDPYGGGRASARETACRVAAAAVAKQWIEPMGIRIRTYLQQVGSISLPLITENTSTLPLALENGAFPCPDPEVAQAMQKHIASVHQQGDSCGGSIGFLITGLPPGLGEPIYGKAEAQLAHALLSIPASKGFEIGQGFQSVLMTGSEHNDEMDGPHSFTSNHAGGILGGISTGQPIYGRVAFKPTSSISRSQQSTTRDGTLVQLDHSNGRHDPCVAIRATVVVEAMCVWVIADLLASTLKCPTHSLTPTSTENSNN